MKIKQADNFFYRIKEDDTSKTICMSLNTSNPNILRNNPKINYYAGEWVKITTNKYKLHIVKPLETLPKIAEKYNTTEGKIIADNHLTQEKLFIGQQLKIL